MGLVLLLAAGASAQPSQNLDSYVLFAQDMLRIQSVQVQGDGDIGVNNGLLYLRDTVSAGSSDMAANVVRLGASTTDCDRLFTNDLTGFASACPKVGPAPTPLIQNLPAACDFPSDAEFAKHNGTPVTVDHDVTQPLTEGSYGDVTVKGGGAGPGVLRLAPGTYHFNNVWVGRGGSILFQGPTVVTVAGNLRISNATDVKAIGSTPASAIEWFVKGTVVRFSRRGDIGLAVCAPNAKMNIGSGTTLTGRFVAKSIRVRRSTVTFQPPVTTTTTSIPTTTTTTLPPCTDDQDCNEGSPTGSFVCENGHCVPACDDDADCNDGSPTGSFVCENGHCVPRCDDDSDCSSAGGAFVCIDGHCVTTTTTTTTTNGSTTTTPSSTTSTTLHPCTTTEDCPVGVCRDGVCVPECQTDEDCNQGSPGGGFVCRDGRCVAALEVCGDCVDNDGDGLIDFEDPDCCAADAGQVFPMDLRKGRFRPKGGSQSLLSLKGGLAQSGLAAKLDPRTQQVLVQISTQTGGEVLCASIPAGSFKKKGKSYRFSLKRTPVPVGVGKNLQRMRIKITKSGKVRYRVAGKRAQLATPAEGALQITVGFTTTGTSSTQNVCSQAVRLFRGGKKGQLSFP